MSPADPADPADPTDPTDPTDPADPAPGGRADPAAAGTVVCATCDGITFTLDRCRCRDGDSAFLITDPARRPTGPDGRPWPDCEQLPGRRHDRPTCRDCRQHGLRRAQLVLTVANLDTGAVASANVVPGVIEPGPAPGGGWRLALAPLLHELAERAGVAPATLLEPDLPDQPVNPDGELSLYLPYALAPRPGRRRTAPTGSPRAGHPLLRPLAGLPRHRHRTRAARPRSAPRPALPARRTTLPRPGRRSPPGRPVRHPGVGHPLRNPRRRCARPPRRPAPRPAYRRGAHHRPQRPRRAGPTVPDRPRSFRQPRPTPPRRDTPGTGRRRPTRTPDPARPGRIVRRPRHLARSTVATHRPATRRYHHHPHHPRHRPGHPPPHHRIPTQLGTTGTRPGRPNGSHRSAAPTAAGTGTRDWHLPCHSCAGSRYHRHGTVLTITNLAGRTVHLNWRPDEQPEPPTLVATDSAGQPVLRFAGRYRLRGWATVFGVRPEDLTDPDTGHTISQDLFDGIVTPHHYGADPYPSYLANASRGRPAGRLIIAATPWDAPTLDQLTRIAHGLGFTVQITVTDHRDNLGDPRLIQGQSWHVELLHPNTPPAPPERPLHASLPEAIAYCLRYLGNALHLLIPDNPQQPIPTPHQPPPTHHDSPAHRTGTATPDRARRPGRSRRNAAPGRRPTPRPTRHRPARPPLLPDLHQRLTGNPHPSMIVKGPAGYNRPDPSRSWQLLAKRRLTCGSGGQMPPSLYASKHTN